MKITFNVTLDMETGDYQIQIFSLDKDKKVIDREKLSILLKRVVESWLRKFQN